jgi:hypothetical protein
VNTVARPAWIPARVVLDPMMSSVFMSTAAGSSSSRVVMLTSSPARPTLRPMTTGVPGGRCRSTRSRTAATCQVRVRDAGL